MTRTPYQRLYWVKRARADGGEEKSKSHLFRAGEPASLCGRKKPTWARYHDDRAGAALCEQCGKASRRCSERG